LNEKLAALLTRHRNVLALLGLIVAAAMGTGLIHSQIRADYKIFFEDDNPYLLANEYIEDTFTDTENVAFIVAPQDGDVFTPETLTAIEELTERGWQMPYSSRVDSITNYQHTFADDEGLVVEPLFQDAEEMSPETIRQRRRIALNEPTLVNNLVSDKGHVTMVSIRVVLPDAEGGNEVRNKEIVDRARELRNEFEQRYPHLEILVFGQVTINNTFNELSVHDSTVLTPIMFGILFVALVALFFVAGATLLTALSAALGTMIVIGLSSIAAMGAAGWLGISLNAATAIAPTIILTIAVADCVHVLFAWLHGSMQGRGPLEAVNDSLDINIQPVFLTSLTTAIGFLALNFSDTPPMQNLGTLTAIGVTMALFLSLGMLPALAAWMPARLRHPEGKARTPMDGLASFILSRQTLFFWGTLVVTLLTLTGIPQNTLNDSPQTYFDETIEFRQASEFYEKHLSGFDRLSYALDSGEAYGISDPDYLRKVDRFVQWLEKQPSITHVNSYTHVIKRLNKNMHGDDPDYHRIPESRELAAQYLLLYELSLPQGLDLNTLMSTDKSSLRIDMRLRGLTPQELIAEEARISEWLADELPEMDVTPGSSVSLMFAHMGQRNINSMFTGNAVAIILITIVLALALGSVKLGLLSVLPNAIPPLVTIGLWGYFHGQVNLAVALIFVITLGIVVDDTVHFLSKYLRARRKQQLPPEQAIRYAFNMVGNALVITSIVLAAGFMVLAQSHFQVNAIMGLLVAITIVVALVFDFLFLPGLLLRLDGNSGENDPAADRQ
jgi:predicted RND superfamily exporter protein